MGEVLTRVMTAIGLARSRVLGWISINQYHAAKSAREFLLVRRTLRESLRELRRFAGEHHRAMLGADSGLAAFTKPGWLPSRPLETDQIVLNLVPAPPPPRSDPLRALVRYWPVSDTGRRYTRYHEAVSALDRPANWFNAASYRMVDVRPAENGDGLSLDLTTTRYWDGFDTTEALAHESAHVYLRTNGSRIDGPFRRALADPFDFRRRHCTIGFAAVTIRRDLDNATFFLMKRGAKVATGVNMTSAVPTGEFQPSNDSSRSVRHDLDLWRAVIREYAEEFLGQEEIRERRNVPVDYDREPPFDLMLEARNRDQMRLYFLGLGIEPLTWKAQIYSVCVFESGTFDQLFAEMTRENAEGVFQLPTPQRASGLPFQGWPFDEATVRKYVESHELSPSSQAALQLTWRHRAVLGLGGDGGERARRTGGGV